MGSLVCALASWLDARQKHGRWLVRIEDIDPPREQLGADKLILDCLKIHFLHWDGDVIYQSNRHPLYIETLTELTESRLCYRCSCTRARLKNLGGSYDQHCWNNPPPADLPSAVRLHLRNVLAKLGLTTEETDTFTDTILGQQRRPFATLDDFIIHRKDGLFSYQLAVTVDDLHQGITHVVRGADLLELTHAQRLMFKIWGVTPPTYAHIPLILDANGNKLSKQNHAPAVDNRHPEQNLLTACKYLGLPVTHETQSLRGPQLLNWATEHWNHEQVPHRPQTV